MSQKGWEWIWKLRGSNRIKFFLWLCHHNRLTTNEVRFIRNMTESAACARCEHPVESMTHALRDCNFSKAVWEQIVSSTQWYEFLNLQEEDWIKTNCTKKEFGNSVREEAPWSLVFQATIWHIWKQRNAFVFSNTKEVVKSTVCKIKIFVDEMLKCFQSATGAKKERRTETLAWTLPNKGEVKINTDGSVREGTKMGTAGGLIRDENGDWIVGFTKVLGDVSITVAELLALREGMSIGWERRFPKVVIEIDSQVIFNLIKNNDTKMHPLESILEECRILLGKPWDARLIHNKRETNSCADALAKMGHDSLESFVIWDSPPSDLVELLAEDLHP